MIMETPLDVLSRAASLVQPDTRENSEPEVGEDQDSPKVMPSSENRRKRNLERRDIAQALNFDDGRLEKLSSVKTAGTQTSPLNPIPTTKSRIESGPPPLISIVPRSEEAGYLHSPVPPHSRPSVITSTNIIRRPVGFMAPSHLYGPTDVFKCYPGCHRREVVESGTIDPFVEEHFRRSLGKDYKCVSPTSMSAAGSVDDHFAKALGDNWQKLKKPEVPTSQSSNPPHLQSIVSPAN